MRELHVKNHYVPECYLKRWGNIDSKIWVYRTLVAHHAVPIWKDYSTSAIAYHKHLYTQIISGEATDELERFLDKEFEAPADLAIEKATSEKRLSSEDWHILIRFLAAQDVRTPVRLAEHLIQSKEYLPNTLEKILNDVKEKLSRNYIDTFKRKTSSANRHDLFPLKFSKELEDGQKTGILKVESYVGRASWIHSIKYLLENTEKVLHTHKWSIIKPAKGYSFFTSDNPVIKLNFADPENYDLQGGWGRQKGNIIFPIGPEHAMFVEIGCRPMPKGSRLTINQTLQFRKFIAENSHRMIFSNLVDDQVQQLKVRIVNVEKVKAEKAEMDKWHTENSKIEKEYF